MKLEDLNRERLLACCGSETWADRMMASAPFRDAAALHEKAEDIWASLGRDDWLEAFAKHPKIGAKASGKWPAQEQAGMSQADRETAETMRELNEQYERKFGFIFIVCATGKTAEEMRRLLEERISNERERELQIAAGEQAKIMHLRLDKLLAE